MFTTNPHLDRSATNAIFRLWISYTRSFWIIAQAPGDYPLEWAFVVSAILALAED